MPRTGNRNSYNSDNSFANVVGRTCMCDGRTIDPFRGDVSSGTLASKVSSPHAASVADDATTRRPNPKSPPAVVAPATEPTRSTRRAGSWKLPARSVPLATLGPIAVATGRPNPKSPPAVVAPAIECRRLVLEPPCCAKNTMVKHAVRATTAQSHC